MTVLIIPRIPPEATVADIREFIAPALISIWPWVKNGKIEQYKIVIYHDKNTSLLEYHAMVFTKTPVLCTKIIKKLNRKKLLGKHVAVREYQTRNWRNDRRASVGLKQDIERGNRKGDRRRGTQLEEITGAPTFLQTENGRKLV